MPARGPSLFLSYRRADTGGYAGRLAEALERHFGRGTVFHDIGTIAPGADFVTSIERAIHSSEVVLVLIGDTWLEARAADGGRLIDREDDFVRIEAATALARGTPVLPLLVEGARMPVAGDLPEDLAPLARQQALELSDSRWNYDVERLLEALRRYTSLRPPSVLRRNMAVLLTAGAVAGFAGAALLVRRLRAPALGGRWNLPSGSFWIIVQDGSRIRIEETHYESRQVWKRGEGVISGAKIAVTLDLVFDARPAETGILRLSADALTLSGELRRGETGPAVSVTLTRDR